MANQRKNWLGGVILIVVGTIALLVNWDLIDRDILRQLWKFWPVILIAVGIKLVMRDGHDRKSPD